MAKMEKREVLKESLVEWVHLYNDKAVLMAGMEEAFIGITYTYGSIAKPLYDTEKCLEIICQKDDVSLSVAIDILEQMQQCFLEHFDEPENTPQFLRAFHDAT